MPAMPCRARAPSRACDQSTAAIMAQMQQRGTGQRTPALAKPPCRPTKPGLGFHRTILICHQACRNYRSLEHNRQLHTSAPYIVPAARRCCNLAVYCAGCNVFDAHQDFNLGYLGDVSYNIVSSCGPLADAELLFATR